MKLSFGNKNLELKEDNLTDFLLRAFRDYEKAKATGDDETLEWHKDFLDFVLWLVTNYHSNTNL